MKKILYVAAAAMFLIAGCKGNGATQPAENAPAQAVGSSDIAFVQVEAVLAQSDLFQSEGAALQEKTKKAQEGWAKKERDLQSKAAQLQEKYQKGLITTANAQSEQEKIQRQIANYQSVAQKEAQTLDEENYVFTNRAQDLIHRAVQELNADKKYKLILNATSPPTRCSTSRRWCWPRSTSCTLPTRRPIRSRRPAADASVYRSDKIPTPCGKSVFFLIFVIVI